MAHGPQSKQTGRGQRRQRVGQRKYRKDHKAFSASESDMFLRLRRITRDTETSSLTRKTDVWLNLTLIS